MSSVLSGQVIKSYRVLEKIDSGGFGAVYRAFQPVIEREVAIKVILPLYANEPSFIRNFEAEAQLVARLEHPHIVPLYDYWRDPDGAYLVMRWLRGGSLRDFITEHPMTLKEASRLLDQIAGALTVAHRNNIVHRDIKPENILLDTDNNFYLTDFGISAQAGKENTSDTVSGSAKYIAPEQLQSQPPTTQSDVYSMGVVLYELLTGKHPFGAGSVSELIFKQLTDPLPLLSSSHLSLPDAVDDVIQRATAKDPTMRYPSMLAMADAFRDAIGIQRTTMEMQQIFTGQDIDNPYKGLRSFTEADAADFFGRDALVDRLLHRLREAEANFLALVGPSGSGKSSVLRAGLLPALRQRSITNFEGWYVADMVPGNNPMQNLVAALLSIAVDAPEDLLRRLQASPKGLVQTAENMLLRMGGNLILFIDQFEELFTQVEDEDVRRHFLDLIYHAATSDMRRMFVVVGIRADFFDKPLLYEGIGDLIQAHTQVVLPLSTEELERAIMGPAKRVGLQIDSDLVTAIVSDVREEPGALPLLQYALTELFERRDGNRLTLEAYHASGGVQGALARRAEEVYQQLNNDLKPLARQVFLRLVTLGEGNEDTRRRAKRAELLALSDNRAAINDVLAAFGQYRLITFDQDSTTREPTVDIAHEALIRNWGSLRDWLADSRSDIRLQRSLNQAAQEWAAHRQDTGYLLLGGRLVQFAEWAQTTTVALTNIETDYLQASIAEQERREQAEAERLAREAALERRSRRLLQTMAVVFAVFGLIAIGLAIAAVQQRQAAQEQSIEAQIARDEALTARGTSDANASVAQAQLEIANRRAAEIQNLNLLNIAEDALRTGDNGLAMQLVLTVADSDIISPAIQNSLYDVAYASVLRNRLTAHGRKVTAIALSPDGQWLATGSEDATVILWNLATGEQAFQLADHRGPINSLTFSADSTLLASAATDATASIWTVATGELLMQLRGHRNVLTDIAFTPDAAMVVTSSGDDTLRVWDLASGAPTLQFEEHGDSVRTVAVHPNGAMVLSAGRDNRLILWDINSGEVLNIYQGHTGEVEAVAFSADGQSVLSASADKTLILWNVETAAVIRRFDGHADIVTSVAFSPDMQSAVSTSCAERDANRACIRGEVIVWDVATGHDVRRLVGHSDTANVAAYAADGSLIYTGSCAEVRQSACIAGEILVWDTQPATDLRFTLAGHASGVLSAAISSDELLAVTGAGTRLAASGGDTSLMLWDLQTGRQLRRLEGHTGDVNTVLFSRDNATIFSASSDGTIRQWDVTTGAEIRRIEGHTGAVFDLALSADGRSLLSTGADRIIRWDVASGTESQSFAGLGANLQAAVIAFSPSGDTFVSGLNNGTIILWNGFGQEIRRYVGHTDDISALTFSPDGQSILSGSADRTARLWDVRTGTVIQLYEGNAGTVTGVVFNPDGTQFLTVSADNAMRLWDVASGEIIRVYAAHGDEITDVALSRSGAMALTASLDGTARVWRISLSSLVTWVENNRYTRPLTPAETTLFQIGLLE
jgi:WD40 repeat protein/serine/threonine protein kinase